MKQELLNQKSLKERWGDHLKSTTLDLRGLLIEAVASHEGWEESAIALVDEAIMPVLNGEGRSEISVVDDTLIEALMNEHDMDIPDDLLASPDHPHFKAHRNGVKAMLHFLDKHGYKKLPEPVSRELEVLKNVVRFADGRCWPEVQAAIDANRELLKHVD